ncbi:phosphoribosyltransferase domain-containing protein [Novosphingobium sp.]|uniref:phosphoribosyltransferase domain-containing protein n=1 Tax=Novosphingobium sp. TaxID=1874826 RepID=UPI0025EE8BCB|nr:phosphoribosyltransferase domain-containing protein [Novosphingobium sp.]MCC6926710.1 phosphoribosyltransferase domain-containing protein [Novosphingobium sp.]
MENAPAFDFTTGAGARSRVVSLPNGALHLEWRERDWPLDRLCAFAARENRRRGFLIVSRVLGRHIPARPAEMRAASNALARQLPADLPEPVLVMGMAETAIALGQSVHQAWCQDSGRRDALYLHSTRQLIGREPIVRFEEPHSHASSHLIYAPDCPEWPHRLEDVQSLVLVDDEVTTGNTFVNLAARLAPLLPQLKRIEIAVLTDWTGGDGFLAAMPAPARVHSLLAGTLAWKGEGDENAAVEPCTGRLGTLDQRTNFGRLGTLGLRADHAALLAQFAPDHGDPLHVVGTGELLYPAFLLAEALEADGHDVLVQATTRSPARVGGAICSVLRLADNYQTGVPNFLYNTGSTGRRLRIVCHETPADSLDPALLRDGDRTIDFGAGHVGVG